MDSMEVTRLLDEICFMFNRATLKSEEHLRYFCRMLKDCDSAAAPHMRNWFRRLDSFPSNLAAALSQSYNAWRATRAHREIKCDFCHGDGWLHYLVYEPAYSDAMEVAGRCPHCAYWSQHGDSVALLKGAELARAKSVRYVFSAAEREEACTLGRFNGKTANQPDRGFGVTYPPCA